MNTDRPPSQNGSSNGDRPRSRNRALAAVADSKEFAVPSPVPTAASPGADVPSDNHWNWSETSSSGRSTGSARRRIMETRTRASGRSAPVSHRVPSTLRRWRTRRRRDATGPRPLTTHTNAGGGGGRGPL